MTFKNFFDYYGLSIGRRYPKNTKREEFLNLDNPIYALHINCNKRIIVLYYKKKERLIELLKIHLLTNDKILITLPKNYMYFPSSVDVLRYKWYKNIPKLEEFLKQMEALI